MVLRRVVVVCWGRGGAGVGCVWASCGLPCCKPPPPSLGTSTGLSSVPRLAAGGRNSPWPLNLSSAAFTWSRRRTRRRELQEGLLSVLTSRRFSYYSRGGGCSEVEVPDDEPWQLEAGDGTGSGEFFDSEHHRYNRIKNKDIGDKVNVGEPVIAALDRLYQIPREAALAMVRQDGFLLVSDTAIVESLYFLKDQNIPREQLMRAPWILLHSAENLQHKFAKLEERHLFTRATDGLGFCWFSLPQITKYQKHFAMESKNFPNHPNRMYYLAEKLEVEVAVLVEKIGRPKSIITMDMNKINNIIDILKKYGVQMQGVVYNLWLFLKHPRFIQDRLRQATEAGCTHPKVWLLYCPPHEFERHIELRRVKNQVLGEDGDVVSYLSSRLGCPPEEIHTGFRRNPLLTSVHAGRFRRMIDMLYEEGFTSQDLRSEIRVLQYPEQRTRQRIHELKSLGEFPFKIYILFKSPKKFSRFVQQIKREKEEEEEKRKERQTEQNGGDS